ncbi:MAG TPA: hypothetical protein PK967_16910 [Candidatus Hydrogenedentes bacterium]|nr:hypothetical protein [Candidatus Hydrogenedentota bacterium]
MKSFHEAESCRALPLLHEPACGRVKSFLHRLNLAAVVLALLVVAGQSAFYRFDGITERGMVHSDVDAWKYLDTAKNWSEGRYTWMSGKYNDPDLFYRPGAHLLHRFAIRWWGYNDYSIKVLNAVMDMGVLLLLFAMAWRIGGNPWLGVVSAWIYGLHIPRLLVYIFGEIPHVPSSFFVMLALAAFVFAMESPWRRSRRTFLLLALTGTALGCAANIHPDLALLGPGCVAILLGTALARFGPRGGAGPFIGMAGILTAGFAIPYVAGMVFFGPDTVIRVFSNELFHSKGVYSAGNNVPGFPVIASKVMQTSISRLFEQRIWPLWAFVSAAGIACATLARGRDAKTPLYAPPVLVLVYALLYGIGIGDFPDRMFRLFIPLLPLFILSITTWHYHGLGWIAGRYATIPFLALTLLAVRFLPVVSEETSKLWLAPSAHGIRLTYNKLKTWVNKDNKLLILPLGAPHAQFFKEGRWGLTHDIYFGSNALFLSQIEPFPFPYDVQALKKICADHKIRYVITFDNRLSEEQILARRPEFKKLDENKPYTREAEMAVIKEFLKTSGSSVIGNWEGGLRQLPPAFGSDGGNQRWIFTMEQKAGGVWRMPGDARRLTPEGSMYTGKMGSESFLTFIGRPLPTDSVAVIRIRCSYKPAGNPQAPYSPVANVKAMWAPSRPSKPGEWPYSNERSVVFTRDDSDPFVFVGIMNAHSRWKGTAGSLTLGIALPPGLGSAEAPADVAVQFIEFLQ